MFERETENESFDTVAHACNILYGENDSMYYFSIGKYFVNNISYIFNDGFMRRILENKIISTTEKGIIADNALTNDDKVRLIKVNFIIKDGDKYKLNFTVFTVTQYDRFKECFDKADARLDNRVVRKLQFLNNFLINIAFSQPKGCENARLVR